VETKAKAKRVDWGKPIQTRDGRQARRIGVLDQHYLAARNVVAARSMDGSCEYLLLATDLGAVNGSDCDIVNAPQKHVRWVNIYETQCGEHFFKSREAADQHAHHTRIACVRIEFTEGEGLTDDPT
jgi:hypothetical protein